MSNGQSNIRTGGKYRPIVRISGSSIPGGGSATVSVEIRDATGNVVMPPPGSVLGIGSAPGQGSVDLVHHWEVAFFSQPGSQNHTTVFAGQNNLGSSQVSIIVAVLIYPDEHNRLIFSSCSEPVRLTIT